MLEGDIGSGLMIFVQSAIDLAESVRQDIRTQGYVSNATLAALKHFDDKHRDFNEVLESNSGLH